VALVAPPVGSLVGHLAWGVVLGALHSAWPLGGAGILTGTIFDPHGSG
jgi:hypothetical protein